MTGKKLLAVLAVATCALAVSVSAPFSSPVAAMGLGEAGELEHARANARAGGPISERDAELLERWGCASGTRNAFCERNLYEQPRRKYRKRRLRRD